MTKETCVDTVDICGYGRQAYLDLITSFHGYPAPGLITAGFMVGMARRALPEGTLFDALSETGSCLPDAVQLLTPCTIGNGWLSVTDVGRYALSLYDKYTGIGVRVHLDLDKLGPYPRIREWLLKEKPKKEQDSDGLRDDMFSAGESILSLAPVRLKEGGFGKRSKGDIGRCPLCGEAYPLRTGGLCGGCAGLLPYQESDEPVVAPLRVPVEEAVGRRALHDMTAIEPGKSKEALFKKGQTISAGDVCRLQHMGRFEVFVEQDQATPGFVHEDQAALELACALGRGRGLMAEGKPKEGRVCMLAESDGLLKVDAAAIERLGLVPDVAVATLRDGSLVRQGQCVASARAIPLHLSVRRLARALAVINAEPPVKVLPLRQARAGLLITGTEVFTGLIEDRFEPILTAKLTALGSSVAGVRLAPDDADAIAKAVDELLAEGADLILTTAGMSVDPGDVTRAGLDRAGLEVDFFGVPITPGNMSLYGRLPGPLGPVDVIGIPACALFYKITALDVILPRVLAGAPPTRAELARMAHGGLCATCKVCTFPQCAFAR